MNGVLKKELIKRYGLEEIKEFDHRDGYIISKQFPEWFDAELFLQAAEIGSEFLKKKEDPKLYTQQEMDEALEGLLEWLWENKYDQLGDARWIKKDKYVVRDGEKMFTSYSSETIINRFKQEKK